MDAILLGDLVTRKHTLWWKAVTIWWALDMGRVRKLSWVGLKMCKGFFFFKHFTHFYWLYQPEQTNTSLPCFGMQVSLHFTDHVKRVEGDLFCRNVHVMFNIAICEKMWKSCWLPKVYLCTPPSSNSDIILRIIFIIAIETVLPVSLKRNC